MAQSNPAQPFHPESEKFVETLKKLNLKRYEELSLEEARERSALASVTIGAGKVEYDGRRDEYFVPSPDVPGGIPVYIYIPNKHGINPPILVYCHGGGNVVGSRLNVETTCMILSQEAGCVVVNVEYRLAPEHKLPAGINDACEVTKWVLANRCQIGGGSSSKVGISGDSAGGQIAAGVAHDVPGLAFQILIYPHVIPNGQRTLPSFQEYRLDPVLHTDTLDWFEKLQSDKSEWYNPRFANILREKFDHLPPCLFVVAECDPIRDESFEYAKKLTEAGVYNEMHFARGAIHAFFTLPGAFPELSKAAHSKAVDFIKTWGTA